MLTNILDISAIIPFKNKADMTISAARSLIKYGPPIKEIIFVSNNSNDSELSKITDFASNNSNAKVLEYNYPFNYQKMNNWATEKATGKFILFLNNDTELVPESRGLLEKMFAAASKPDVGITGCLLLYGDRKVIQHAGVFLQPRGMADHLYVGKKYSKVLKSGGKNKDYPYSIDEDRPLTAVTGAVNIIEKAKFLSIGGYDENFIIGGGDVDLCIRLNKKGCQTWYIAGGWIVHKESQSRSHKPIEYSDFYNSYLSYMTAYDYKVGDPYLPKITEKMI